MRGCNINFINVFVLEVQHYYAQNQKAIKVTRYCVRLIVKVNCVGAPGIEPGPCGLRAGKQ